jgi:hypothetical protein
MVIGAGEGGEKGGMGIPLYSGWRTPSAFLLSSSGRRYPSCRLPLLALLFVLVEEVVGLIAEFLGGLRRGHRSRSGGD